MSLVDQLPHQIPLVSVVIPCYNQAEFLKEAIESALSQTHSRVEVIVVDDGSSDDTPAVSNSYEVRYFRQENCGLGTARNRGLQESSGEFLIFLDSDDRLRRDAIEKGLKLLTASPGAAFAYGRCDIIDSAGSFLMASNQPHVDSGHYLQLLQGNFMPNPAALLFRRAHLEAAGGFNPDMPGAGAEDYEICLRLTRQYEACAYQDVVADYRQHGASLSHKTALMSESVHAVLQAQKPFVSGNPVYEKAWKQGLKNWRRNHYAYSLVARARGNARQRRWWAFLHDVFLLLRLEPQILFENAWRKTRVEFSKILGRGGVLAG